MLKFDSTELNRMNLPNFGRLYQINAAYAGLVRAFLRGEQHLQMPGGLAVLELSVDSNTPIHKPGEERMRQ